MFGRSGAYEKIAGRLYFEVDPCDPANAAIHDLGLAPRNASGKTQRHLLPAAVRGATVIAIERES